MYQKIEKSLLVITYHQFGLQKFPHGKVARLAEHSILSTFKQEEQVNCEMKEYPHDACLDVSFGK
jgi:hypothetical protein